MTISDRSRQLSTTHLVEKDHPAQGGGSTESAGGEDGRDGCTPANPAVHVAIVGAQSPSHIEDSVAAAELRLSEADLEQINRIVAGSIPLPGPSPEMMPQ